MNKLIHSLLFLSLSAAVVVSFQNCSQAGNVAALSSSDSSNGSQGNDFVVPAAVPDVSTPPSNNGGSGNSRSSDTSSNSAPQSTPPGDTPSAPPQNPTPAGDHDLICGNKVSDYMFSFNHLVLQCDGDDDEGSHDKKHDDHGDHDKEHDDHDKESGREIAIAQGENVFSLNKNYIVIEPSESEVIKCNHLKAILNPAGNFLLLAEGKKIPLEAHNNKSLPSGMIFLDRGTELVKGKKYKLTLSLIHDKRDHEGKNHFEKENKDDDDDKDHDKDDHEGKKCDKDNKNECRLKAHFNAVVTEFQN